MTLLTYDIDSAELLHKHDKKCALCSSAVTSDSEKFFPGIAAFALCGLNLEELVCVVHVACSLHLVSAKSAKSCESLVELALLHVP